MSSSHEQSPSLFPAPPAPLAERMRPQTLGEFFGQPHLLGPDQPLRRLIERDRLPSMILWGAPGTGKTTLVRIVAHTTGARLTSLSAVASGVKEVRQVIDQAAVDRQMGRRTILFIDEIHRFNKAQQDALLHAVEDGTMTLIGATTENPSFEVIGPLLSRCRVFRFEPLSKDDIAGILDRALSADDYLTALGVQLEPPAHQALIDYAAGDARYALNGLETAVELALAQRGAPPLLLDLKLVEKALMVRAGKYDKKGDYHYDVISAFIKSIRGSDPDAAVYWLARMLESGEDPLFIARRMIVLASEDIGNANPTALILAQACVEAVHFIGMPEACLTLSQTAVYLASSPKSNASYRAIIAAQEEVRRNPDLPVPLHLRNPVTGLMRGYGYGKDYRYAHDYEGSFAEQQYLPEGLEDRLFYHPSDQGGEKSIAERLKNWWKKRRGDFVP